MDRRGRGGMMRGSSNWGFNRNRPFHGRRGEGSFRGNSRNFREKPGFGYHSGSMGHRHSPNRGRPDLQRLFVSEMPTKRLTEGQIGATEFISDHEGFGGIIKSRYSDFQVSEINLQGEVAKLTDTSYPNPPEDEVFQEDEQLLSKYNLETLPMETWDNINSLALSNERNPPDINIDVTGLSKEQRTKIHDAVKKAFSKAIISSTVTEGDKKFVRLQKYRKGVRVDKRVRWTHGGEYVYFVLYKENCDTMEAASKLADRQKLSLKPSMMGYAGTKDRRAKTSQWFSLRRVEPKKIASACQGMREIKVGNFEFRSEPLKLGMLKGNKFRIALRNVTATADTVTRCCEELRARGFLNYYGLQRFGSRVDTPTYDIGLKLLQGNYRETINLILSEREGPLQLALRAYHAAGPVPALRLLPRYYRTGPEVRVLKALARDNRDLLGAITQLPRNTRLLYMHAYQSWVWNRCVSERVRRGGLRPLAGDLVPLGELSVEDILNESDTAEDPEDEELDDGDKEKELEVLERDEGKDITLEQSDNGEQDKMADVENKNAAANNTVADDTVNAMQVKVLTQEDIDSEKYTIFDVVLPLPGFSIQYPPNMKDFYEEILAKDELKLELRSKIRSLGLSGAYRCMVVRPLSMEWSSVSYSDPHADLILSDWDELEGKTLTGVVEGGSYQAVLLSLSLPASCYATMALRELLRRDTSSLLQALQNNYHLKRTHDKGSEEESKKAKVEAPSDPVEVQTQSDISESHTQSESSIVEGSSD